MNVNEIKNNTAVIKLFALINPSGGNKMGSLMSRKHYGEFTGISSNETEKPKSKMFLNYYCNN